MKIVNDMLCAMDKDKCTAFIMLDLSAAFDTINQDILLNTLDKSFGISDVALKWL